MPTHCAGCCQAGGENGHIPVERRVRHDAMSGGVSSKVWREGGKGRRHADVGRMDGWPEREGRERKTKNAQRGFSASVISDRLHVPVR